MQIWKEQHEYKLKVIKYKIESIKYNRLAATLRLFTTGVQSASLYDNFRKPGNYVIMTSLMTL